MLISKLGLLGLVISSDKLLSQQLQQQVEQEMLSSQLQLSQHPQLNISVGTTG
jgi:hypothetical protein